MADHDDDSRTSASWYLIQYTADLRKREPRNVGVMLEASGEWLARFYAEVEPGKVNGRRLRHLDLVREPYEAWIRYYRRKVAENRWDDVERAQGKRPSNFSAALGGKIALRANTAPDAELQRLFNELVEGEPEKILSITEQLKDRASRLFERAQIPVERNVKTSARLGDGTRTVQLPFDFSFMNGQLHLAEAVSLGGWHGERSALAFNARVKAVRDAGAVANFLALYDSNQIDPAHEDVILSAMEGVAHTVDMAEGNEAVATLREIAHLDED